MKTYDDIQNKMNLKLEEYLKKQSEKGLSYFKWDTSFFIKNLNLRYPIIKITSEIRKAINITSKNYFNSIIKHSLEEKKIAFTLCDSIYNPRINIEGIEDIIKTSENKLKIRSYNHIFEFILLDILSKNYLESERIIKNQYNRFLFSYISFLTSEENKNDKQFIISIFKKIGYTIFEKDNTILFEKEINKRISNNKIIFLEKNSDNTLAQIINLLPDNNNPLHYRGQSNASWRLASSLTKMSINQKNEINMFHELLSLKPNAFDHDKTSYEKLITMQLLGLPTRLINITRNPLIALYFACNDVVHENDNNSDGKLLIFDKKKIHYKYSKEANTIENKNIRSHKITLPKKYSYYSKEIEDLDNYYNKKEEKIPKIFTEVCYINAIAINQRITIQSGDFIFIGNGNHEETLENLPIKEIIIDAKLKPEILKELELLNIHAGTVYPDLSNMIEYINHKYKTNYNEQT